MCFCGAFQTYVTGCAGSSTIVLPAEQRPIVIFVLLNLLLLTCKAAFKRASAAHLLVEGGLQQTKAQALSLDTRTKSIITRNPFAITDFIRILQHTASCSSRHADKQDAIACCCCTSPPALSMSASELLLRHAVAPCLLNVIGMLLPAPRDWVA
jgi:hypothetical protein